MAAIRHEARGVAREPDGGTLGRQLEYSLDSEYCFYAEYSANGTIIFTDITVSSDDVRLCICIQT